MSKDNGGPAFPIPGFEYLDDRDPENTERVAYLPAPGMTLRDYFAAKAVQGFSAHLVGAERKGSETHAQANARLAYQYADAMLAERAK